MAMAEQSESFDIDSIRSRISELNNFVGNVVDLPHQSSPDADVLLRECVQKLENQVEEIVSEHSGVQCLDDEDFDPYMELLRKQVEAYELESNKLSKEIDDLKETYLEGACQLEGELESLNFALANVKSLEESKTKEPVEGVRKVGALALSKKDAEQKFQELELSYQLEQNAATLKSLQELDHMLKRYEAIGKIEESFSGLKVLDFEGDNIRLSLKTYIPHFEGLMHLQKLRGTIEPSELSHELQIELMGGSMELKNAEIFPNDVYIGDILEALSSISHGDSAIGQRSFPLRWFVQKVQDRIVLCSLRQFMVKNANKSRHSVEYLDREELFVTRIRGIDSFIKPCQGWPLSTSVLKLISLKPSDAEEISPRLLCEIEELANSLDLDTRRNITSFIDFIEEIIAQKLRHESN